MRYSQLIKTALFTLSLIGTAISYADTAPPSALPAPAASITAPTSDTRLAEILPAFEKYAQDVMHEAQTPGMVIGIVKDGKLIFVKGYGVKKVGTQDPVNADTLFQIGSASKTFTSALNAQLIDKGLMKWSDHVVDHNPDFMLYDPLVTREFTVKDLYAQDSGLPEHAGDNVAILGYSGEHVLQSLRYIKPVSFFRTEYAYQNIMFAAGAELMRKTSGKTWHQLLQENIFNQLDMKNSGATMDFYKNAKNASALHKIENGKVVSYPIDTFGENTYYTIYAPAGGILSTVNDLSHWAIMQLNMGTYNGKRIVSEENIRIMHEPQTIAKEMYGVWSYYALGWVYNEYNPYPLVWHNGGTGGARSMVMLIPHEKMAIIILSNLAGTQLPEAISYQFVDMYFGNKQTQTWNEKLAAARKKTADEAAAKPKPAVAIQSPALALNAYTGTYENKVFGKINVIEKNKQLVVVIGPTKFELPMMHVNRDIFTIADSIKSSTDAGNGVTFHVDATGKAASVNIEMLDVDSDGYFTRVE